MCGKSGGEARWRRQQPGRRREQKGNERYEIRQAAERMTMRTKDHHREMDRREKRKYRRGNVRWHGASE